MKAFLTLLVIHEISVLVFGQSSSTTLIDYCGEAQKHFAKQKTLTAAEWNSSLPTEEESREMQELLTRLYKLSTYTNLSPPLSDYPSLQQWINITLVQDYLIIHEIFPKDGSRFPRNWGLVALAEPTTYSRTLHHSAVHFDSEGAIYEEAAYVAQMTGSRSLALHGASRYALDPPVASTCQSSYTVTDGAHNANTMFHIWSSTLYELSERRGEDYVFVQWHGMAESNCGTSEAFASCGTRNPSAYGSDSIPTKVKIAFNYFAAPLLCSTPLENAACTLVGSDNPLGRLINGVKTTDVCKKKARNENVTGRFLHIEQKEKARIALDAWTRTFSKVFPAA